MGGERGAQRDTRVKSRADDQHSARHREEADDHEADDNPQAQIGVGHAICKGWLGKGDVEEAAGAAFNGRFGDVGDVCHRRQQCSDGGVGDGDNSRVVDLRPTRPFERLFHTLTTPPSH